MVQHASMRTRPGRAAALILAVVAIAAGCAGSTGVASGPAGKPSPVGGSSAPAAALDRAWAVGRLVDATTGASFRIADHAGKVVILETMAIWCSSCLSQQRDVAAALDRLPADRVVYVVLDVDPNEDAASLADYRERHGFPGRYAVASTEVARSLAAEFGDQFLNPPSTPMLVVGTDGSVTRTAFGHKSPTDIVALAEAHGA